MKSNSITWLLLTLIYGCYSLYLFSSTRTDSWYIISGVVLAAGSVVSPWKYLRDTRASKVERSVQVSAGVELLESAVCARWTRPSLQSLVAPDISEQRLECPHSSQRLGVSDDVTHNGAPNRPP